MTLMMIGNAVNGLVLWNTFLMHMRGTEVTFTDTMHVTLAGVGVIFVLLALGSGAVAFRKWFCFYTIGTLLALILTGVATFLYVPKVSANLSTQWLGLTERISTYIYLLWQAVLSIVLFRAEKSQLENIKI